MTSIIGKEVAEMSAKKLLVLIQEEKERMIKAKETRRQSSLPEVKKHEEPYELPKNWTWTRFGEIVEFIGGTAFPKSLQGKSNGLMPFFKVSDIKKKNSQNVLEDAVHYVDEEEIAVLKKKHFNGKAILTAKIGESIRKNNRAMFNGQCYFDNNVLGIRPILIDLEFLYVFLDNIDMAEFIQSTSVPSLNMDKVKAMPFPLPPMNVQRAIAKRMKLFYSQRDLLLEKLGDQKLELQRYRQATLQEAMRGELVEQDLEEGTGQKLLASIQLERGGKKKQELFPIETEEAPYEVPHNWTWARLGEVIHSSPRNSIADDSIEASFIPMALVEDSWSPSFKDEVREWGTIKKGYTHFQEGDVVFAKITPCFQNRKSAILDNLKNGVGAGSTELIALRSINNLVLQKYLFYTVISEEFIRGGVSTYTGTAGQQRISMDWFRNYPLPLPPLAEQKRIVEKLDIIMSVCDRLEKELETTKAETEKWYRAILQEAFQPEVEEE